MVDLSKILNPAKAFPAEIDAVYVTPLYQDTLKLDSLRLELTGPQGDKHSGPSAMLDVRLSRLAQLIGVHRGTTIQNLRPVTVVSSTDNAVIAGNLGINPDQITGYHLQANLEISTPPHWMFSKVPSGTLIVSATRQWGLYITGANSPCEIPANRIASQFDDTDPDKAKFIRENFLTAAEGRRGVTAIVLIPGVVKLIAKTKRKEEVIILLPGWDEKPDAK